jgi:hypothetical protein
MLFAEERRGWMVVSLTSFLGGFSDVQGLERVFELCSLANSEILQTWWDVQFLLWSLEGLFIPGETDP